jgi:hypothetical protein
LFSNLHQPFPLRPFGLSCGDHRICNLTADVLPLATTPHYGQVDRMEFPVFSTTLRLAATTLFAAIAATLSFIYIPSPSRAWTLAAVLAGVLFSVVQLWRRFLPRSARPVQASTQVPPPDGPADAPPGQRPYIPPFELPPIPLLVGRDAEIEDIVNVLKRDPTTGVRVIALIGAPGVGKTALAIAAAHAASAHFPGGILYAELQGLGSTHDAVSTLLGSFVNSLQGENENIPETLDARRSTYRQLTAPDTRSAAVLIILDGVENADLARQLLPASPRSAVILTATARPDLDGVEEQLVKPLTLGDATRLFRELVALPVAPTPAEERAAAAIVSRTAGYPLALQLTAAALAGRRNWSLGRIARMLNQSPTDPTQDPRHRALDLSFVLLASDEQVALKLLGLLSSPVFSPWVLVALWPMAGPTPIEDATALRICERLANVRLLEQLADDATGVVAFRILEHVRDYALALWTPDEQPDVRDAAREHIRAARSDRRGRSPLSLLREHVYRDLDQGDLTGSLNQARNALSLARELVQNGQILESSGEDLAEGERLALAALAEVLAELGGVKDAEEIAAQAVIGGYPSAEARALRCRGRLSWRQRRLTESIACLAQAREAARTVGDGAEEIRILRELAIAHALHGNLVVARTLLDDINQFAAPESIHNGLSASVEWARSVVELEAYDAGESEDLDRLADIINAAIEAASQQRLWRAWARLQLARVERRRQRHAQARVHALATLDEFVAMRHRYGAATCRWETGRSFLDQHRHSDALPMLEEAREIFSTCGDRWVEACVAVDLARALRLHGRLNEADRELADAAQLYQSLGPAPTGKEPTRALAALLREVVTHKDASRNRAVSRDLQTADAVSSAW